MTGNSPPGGGPWTEFWANHAGGDGTLSGGGCLPEGCSGIEDAQKAVWYDFIGKFPKSTQLRDLATGDGRVLKWMLAPRRDLNLTEFADFQHSTYVSPRRRHAVRSRRCGIRDEARPRRARRRAHTLPEGRRADPQPMGCGAVFFCSYFFSRRRTAREAAAGRLFGSPQSR